MENHIQIQGIVPRIQYIADGSTTLFEYPFAIFKAENLQVYINSELQNSNTYTVSGAGNTDGGSITFLSAPEEGAVITLVRSLSIERTTDFQEGGAFRANALNYELDYQIACQQQIADALNRTMVLPPYAVDENVDFTLPVPAAGKAIVWNAAGTNLENSTIEINALESTLNGYKQTAQSAASDAASSAQTATSAASTATSAAGTATTAAQTATAAVSQLQDKLNTSLDNLSSAGQAKIVGFCVPDYTAGVSKTWNTDITAECDGFVIANCLANQSTLLQASVNNVTLPFYELANAGSLSICFPVAKDDVWKVFGGNGNYNVTFYPMKGVVNA